MNGKIQYLLQEANSQDSNENSVSFAKRDFTTLEKAQTAFLRLKEKLLNLDNWSENSGLSSYELFDENGNVRPDKTLAADSFIRIALTGSGKYDWVKVIEIYEAEDEFVIIVNPTFDPTGDNPDKTSTSHFFSAEATNNFCLLQNDKSVDFYVIGINEKQNSGETENTLEIVRNVAVANLGSYLGIQKSVWTKFCENFLSSVAEEI